jgi:hypothetical protein
MHVVTMPVVAGKKSVKCSLQVREKHANVPPTVPQQRLEGPRCRA